MENTEQDAIAKRKELVRKTRKSFGYTYGDYQDDSLADDETEETSE
jgi:hypothetical protein